MNECISQKKNILKTFPIYFAFGFLRSGLSVSGTDLISVLDVTASRASSCDL